MNRQKYVSTQAPTIRFGSLAPTQESWIQRDLRSLLAFQQNTLNQPLGEDREGAVSVVPARSAKDNVFIIS